MRKIAWRRRRGAAEDPYHLTAMIQPSPSQPQALQQEHRIALMRRSLGARLWQGRVGRCFGAISLAPKSLRQTYLRTAKQGQAADGSGVLVQARGP